MISTMSAEQKTAKIARLNDAFRANPIFGLLMLSPKIRATPLADVDEIIEQVGAYNDFTNANNPYGEKDFGAFDYHNHKIFWKIDYYDKDLRQLSPDASNPKLTIRVLTIMYAEEY